MSENIGSEISFSEKALEKIENTSISKALINLKTAQANLETSSLSSKVQSGQSIYKFKHKLNIK